MGLFLELLVRSVNAKLMETLPREGSQCSEEEAVHETPRNRAVSIGEYVDPIALVTCDTCAIRFGKSSISSEKNQREPIGECTGVERTLARNGSASNSTDLKGVTNLYDMKDVSFATYISS